MPPDPSLGPSADPNPWLKPLRREIQAQRSGMLGRQVAPFLDAFELHVAEQDRRIAALGIAVRTLLEANGKLERRALDLERQVAAQADELAFQKQRITGLMPPGECVTDEQFALMHVIGELKDAAIDRGPA